MANWIKGFLLLYLLLLVFQDLSASEKYEHYIRFFSGLLLVLYCLSSFTRLLGQSQELSDLFRFQSFRQNLDSFQAESQRLQELQSKRVQKEYGQVFAEDIKAFLLKEGIETAGIKVLLDGRYQVKKIELVLICQGRRKDQIFKKTESLLQDLYQLDKGCINLIAENKMNKEGGAGG